MKLKGGGTYKQRDGVVVRIIRKSKLNSPYKFVGDKGHTYTEDGIYCLGGLATFDLISEVNPPKVDNPYGEDNHPLPPMKEEGTLAELKVQPGDVVENTEGGRRPKIFLDKEGEVCYTYYEHLSGVPIEYASNKYRLISRADKPPRTWGELNDAEKGALLLAYHEGKTIQCKRTIKPKEWTDLKQKPTWSPPLFYRIKPEPKVLVEKKRGTMVFHDGVMVEGSWRSEEDIYNNGE